jgi:hypothetical protein
MSQRLMLLLEAMDLLRAEATDLAARGPTFKIFVRRNAGKELRAAQLEGACLAHRAQDYPVRLGTRDLWFFYDLALHRRGRTASQIAVDLRQNPFFAVTGPRSRNPWRIARSSIRQYVKRVRMAMTATFIDALIGVNVECVLRSETTSGNETLYRLQAQFQILESDIPRYVVVTTERDGG